MQFVMQLQRLSQSKFENEFMTGTRVIFEKDTCGNKSKKRGVSEGYFF